MKRIAVFDVCNTLINDNTTAAFVQFVSSRSTGVWRRLGVWLIRSKRSPVRVLLAVLYRLGVGDIPKACLVYMLRGYSREQLQEYAKAYVQSASENAAIKQTWSFVDDERANGSEILLVSASLCIVVDALANLIGAQGIGSRLEFCNGYCTGRLLEDISGRKVELVKGFLGDRVEGYMIVAFSDNVSDLPLLEYADKGYAICTSKSNGLRGCNLPEGVEYVSAE